MDSKAVTEIRNTLNKLRKASLNLEKHVPTEMGVEYNLEQLRSALTELHENMEALKQGVEQENDCPIQVKK